MHKCKITLSHLSVGLPGCADDARGGFGERMVRIEVDNSQCVRQAAMVMLTVPSLYTNWRVTLMRDVDKASIKAALDKLFSY